MLCRECEKRSSCVALCAEAERYVGQDRVPQGELLGKRDFADMATADFEGRPEPWDTSYNLGKTERTILYLVLTDKTHAEIASIVGFTRRNVSYVWAKIKAKAGNSPHK